MQNGASVDGVKRPIVRMLVRTTAISAHFVHQGHMSFSAFCAIVSLALPRSG